MWSKAFKLLEDIYRGAKSSSEERYAYATTVTRLRQVPKGQALWCDNTDEKPEQKQQPSLFSALHPGYASHLPERKAVGHWFKMTVPNARDKQLKQAVRSYEVDFRPGFDMEDTNFEQFLTASAKKKALEQYIICAQNKQSGVYSAPSSDRRSLPAPVPELTAEESEQTSMSHSTGFSETDELLIRLAQDDDHSVRSSVAGNEHAPIAVLWLLSDDESSAVKLNLIANPKCPLAILEKLTRDFDSRVSRKAQVALRRFLSNDIGIASGNLSSDICGEQEGEQDENDSETELLAM